MTETYRLDEKQLPDIPVPHDCGIKRIRLEDRTLEIAFEDDISRHDAIQYWKPDAKSLVMRFHLDCEPEDCEILRWVRRRKPFGRNGHYRVIGFEELSGLTESRLEYLYHYVTYCSVTVELFTWKTTGNILLKMDAKTVELEWIC